MTNYIEIEATVPTCAASAEWYRTFLPAATATFTAPTCASSVEMVAGGLGTCHVPFSLLPNLSAAILQEVRLFRITGMNRWVVLAMRKHLQTHAAFAHIFNELTAYCRGEYLEAMHEDQIGSFDALHRSALSGSLYTAAD